MLGRIELKALGHLVHKQTSTHTQSHQSFILSPGNQSLRYNII